MALFNWTLSGTGDWITPENWTLLLGFGNPSPPPGSADFAIFANAGAGYTVNVTTSVDVALTAIVPTTSTASFSISGSLTTNDLIYATAQPISTTVADGGLLHVTNALESLGGHETITISGTGAGGQVELGDVSVGASFSNVSFDFANAGPASLNTGVIEFGNDFASGVAATQVITNVASGNEFAFPGADFTGDTVSFDPDTNDLTVNNGVSTVFTMDNIFLQPGFTGGFEIVNGNTIEAIACYARGTMILTDRGEAPIEELSIGDRAVTLFGEARPIRWIGRRAYDARFVAGNRALLPVLIRQDALGNGVPRRDLYVSPKHALFLDDVLVPAEQLVNGVSILRCDTIATVEYFHIELDTHDIILAEGAPSETFVDCDNRFMFQNAHEFARLYPNRDAPTWAFCAPRVEEGDVLQYLRWRLDERLEAFGCTTTFDPDLHLVVDGVPVSADRVDDAVHIFKLERLACEVRIVSRSSVPAELDVASTDIRRLGVNVSRVVLSSDDVDIVVGCGDTSLVDGFHACEGTHRWTDGDARVPAKFLACFDKDVTIEVHVRNHDLSYRTGQWGAERFVEKADAVPANRAARCLFAHGSAK